MRAGGRRRRGRCGRCCGAAGAATRRGRGRRRRRRLRGSSTVIPKSVARPASPLCSPGRPRGTSSRPAGGRARRGRRPSRRWRRRCRSGRVSAPPAASSTRMYSPETWPKVPPSAEAASTIWSIVGLHARQVDGQHVGDRGRPRSSCPSCRTAPEACAGLVVEDEVRVGADLAGRAAAAPRRPRPERPARRQPSSIRTDAAATGTLVPFCIVMPLPLSSCDRARCAPRGAPTYCTRPSPANRPILSTRFRREYVTVFPGFARISDTASLQAAETALLTALPNGHNLGLPYGHDLPPLLTWRLLQRPSYPDTPIYDMLVNERGTPQIAPIRVPSAFEPVPSLPALPPARPALPAAPSQQNYAPPQGYPGAMGPQPTQPGMGQPGMGQPGMGQPGMGQPGMGRPGMGQPAPLRPAPLQSAPLQQTPAPYIPQQAPVQRGVPDPRQQPPQQQQATPPPQQMRPVAPRPAAPRPAAPRPAAPRQMPNTYDDPYGGQQYPGRGF